MHVYGCVMAFRLIARHVDRIRCIQLLPEPRKCGHPQQRDEHRRQRVQQLQQSLECDDCREHGRDFRRRIRRADELGLACHRRQRQYPRFRFQWQGCTERDGFRRGGACRERVPRLQKPPHDRPCGRRLLGEHCRFRVLRVYEPGVRRRAVERDEHWQLCVLLLLRHDERRDRNER